MSEERPVNLDFLAEQQQQILAEQRLMLDELRVQGAITRRIDATQAAHDRNHAALLDNHAALLDELRAIHALLARVLERVRVLEDRQL
jgi:hypothetical protein